jgi:hypothetical protein
MDRDQLNREKESSLAKEVQAVLVEEGRVAQARKVECQDQEQTKAQEAGGRLVEVRVTRVMEVQGRKRALRKSLNRIFLSE